MRVLHVISSAGYYGAEAMVVNLCHGLKALGVSSALAVFENRHLPNLEVAEVAQQQGIEVLGLSCNGRADLRAVGTLAGLAREWRADVIHAHGYKAQVYASLSAQLFRLPLVATCHGYQARSSNGGRSSTADLRQRIYGALNGMMLRGYVRVAATSEKLAEMLAAAGVARRKLSVTGNGIDITAFQGAAPAEDIVARKAAGFAIGLVARLIPGKGHREMLQALSGVLARYPQCVVFFVGEGAMRGELELEAKKIGVAANVVFTGLRSDMAAVYAALDAVVLPSHAEGMPMVLLEAMSASLPVIATPVGAVPELIVDRKTGVLVDVGDIAGLSQAILRIVAEPEWRAAMADEGMRYVAANFSAERMAAQYREMYEEACHA
jgi:glycosyltransferase involved in cell wall biosynthesis